MKSAHEILASIKAGRAIALARAITHVESGDALGDALLAELAPASESAEIIGVTGPPGTGKSTLVSALAKLLRAKENSTKLGIVAVDPSSPFSGGALLGDRLRMSGIADDEGVFIRSMASRGALGGLAAASDAACDLMAQAGFSRLIVETVGVGQSEVDIASACDTTLVVLNPESGDSVQAIKAGLMEIADILVVNKADHPRAQKFANDVASGLELRAHGRGPLWLVPVVSCIATEAEGIEQLFEAITRHREFLRTQGELETRRLERTRKRLTRLWQALNAKSLGQNESLQTKLAEAASQVLAGKLSIYAAAQNLSRASLKS